MNRTAAPFGPRRGPASRRWLIDPRAPIVALIASIPVGLFALVSLAWAGSTTEAIIVDAASGFAFILAGVIAWRRRPDNRVGPIMVAIGFAWFGGDFLFAPVPLVGPLSLAAQAAARVLFAWLLLSFPSGRLDSAIDRAAVIVIGALAILLAVLQLLTFKIAELCDCPGNPFAIAADTSLADIVGPTSSAVGILMTLILVPLIIRRVVRASGPARPALLPVLAGGMFSLLSVTPQLISDLGGPYIEPVSWLPIVYIALPIGFLVALLNQRIARGAVADLVVELGDSPAPERLREALATALHDPTLEVVRWSADRNAYVDATGAVIPPPVARPDRAVTLLESDHGRLAALVHDPALLDDPGLVASVGAAMRLAVENEQLQRKVAAQLEDVRASRARIVTAGDAERRRLERDLHDGAQQRLVALSLALRRAQAGLDQSTESGVGTSLEEASQLARDALTELRELARGIHPAVLTEAGLAGAIASLARDAPVDVRVETITAERFPTEVEGAAYFFVSEALANVSKYAGDAHATIRTGVHGNELIVEVTDDGPGGAAPTAGSGLQGLEDRLAAIGGVLVIDSGPGQGTRLQARIPIDGTGR